MAYNLIIQDEAIYDTRQAFEWYEEQKPGLGYEFIGEVEACFDQIQNHPDHYSYINNLYRRIKLRRFPYVIVYELEADEIIVNSVRHVKRKPMA